MGLEVSDPLAHRALDALLRAETSLRRTLAADLERHGLSTAGFSALVVLTTAGGSMPLRALRNRLRWSKANATEVTATLAAAGHVVRHRDQTDRRAVTVEITRSGAALVERLFPEHSRRVTDVFARLDEPEKRSLADLCRKLAA